MGKSFTAGIGLTVGLLLGFILGILQPVSASHDRCYSPPEVTLLLQKEYPLLKNGLILQNETLRAFVIAWIKAGGPSPTFSFDVLYLYEDKADGTTGMYFFNEGCYQAYLWVPSDLVNKLIKETNDKT